MKKTSGLWTAEQYSHLVYMNHIAVGPFPGCSSPQCARNHAGRVMCVVALRGESAGFGGQAATTTPQFQGQMTPDCQPRVLAATQAAEQPAPPTTDTAGRRSVGRLSLPRPLSAGCPRSGPASWLFEAARQWSAAVGTTTWRRLSAAWPSGRTPTVLMPGIAWTVR